jgi:hypothetical protein
VSRSEAWTWRAASRPSRPRGPARSFHLSGSAYAGSDLSGSGSAGSGAAAGAPIGGGSAGGGDSSVGGPVPDAAPSTPVDPSALTGRGSVGSGPGSGSGSGSGSGTIGLGGQATAGRSAAAAGGNGGLPVAAAVAPVGVLGWHLYQTTSCDNQDARNQMDNGKTGITNAESGRDTAGRTCRSALEAAAAKADVPTAPPQQQGVPHQISTTPGQVGTAPSGREPVPFTGPIAAGQPRPYVDPANGRIVVPAMGPYATGKRPWVYQN